AHHRGAQQSGRGAVRRAPVAQAGQVRQTHVRAPAPRRGSGEIAMIIVLKSGIGDSDVEDICRRVTEMGYAPHVSRGAFKTLVAAVGEERGRPDLRLLEAVEIVESVMPVQQPFKLASREVRREPSEVRVNGVVIGGKDIVVMAGPCSVESEGQVLEVAYRVKEAGARLLRGGALKSPPAPHALQGLKERGRQPLAD